MNKQNFKFGTLCYEETVGAFIVSYKTKDEKKARDLHKCITDDRRSFISFE